MDKKVVYGLWAVLAVCSCQVVETDKSNNPGSKVFTAIIEDSTSGATRSSLDTEGNVLWKIGDQVSIFAGTSYNGKYQVTDESDGKTAAELVEATSGSGSGPGTPISDNVAFYPYGSSAVITPGEGEYVISATLPAVQYYVEDSFGNGAFPMAAVSPVSDWNFRFKNVLGGLKLQLKGSARIAAIRISGNNNEDLCGAASVTVSKGNVPAISMAEGSSKMVTLNCGDGGVQLNTETATSFIIALPPMTMADGFTVLVSDTNNASMEIKTTKSQTITRSNLLKMPAVDFEGVINPEYVDLGLSVKWAACNLGATLPEGYGDYFAWGELEPYYEPGYSQSASPVWRSGKSTGYDWPSYKWCEGTYSTINKYYSVDMKKSLDLEDDAAYMKYGGKWRMPSKAEWEELNKNCTGEMTYINSIYGIKFTSNVTGYTDNWIFLPATAYWSDAGFGSGSLGIQGHYWSSTLNNSSPYDRAWQIYFEPGSGDNFQVLADSRRWGLSIRPVLAE